MSGDPRGGGSTGNFSVRWNRFWDRPIGPLGQFVVRFLNLARCVTMLGALGQAAVFFLQMPHYRLVSEEEIRPFRKSVAGHLGRDDLPEWVRGAAKDDYRQAIEKIASPFEAWIYCMTALRYRNDPERSAFLGGGDDWDSFRRIHERKGDDCDGGAIAAAALLSDDGYPPYILMLWDGDSGHAVFVYRSEETKGFGSVGINLSDYHPPRHASLQELVDGINAEAGESYRILGVLEFTDTRYIHGDGNIAPGGILYTLLAAKNELGDFITGLSSARGPK